MSFVPKQAFAPNADLYEEIVGDSTLQIAEAFLKLIPPIPGDAVIHDNGCGGGQVIQKVMETNPPSSIRFEATDIDPTQIASCKRSVSANGWPATVSEMAAESLTFADETFTHSLSNLLLMATKDTGAVAAREIYRTLKPGGTAVATWFRSIPHQEVIKDVHLKLRGTDNPLPHGMPDAWYETEFLTSVVAKGGFSADKIRTVTADVACTIPNLERWVTILWSYLGRPVKGWAQADEDNWDQVIATIKKGVEASPGYQSKGDGGVLIMKANICIATK